jgi:transglutaminase-like putative cysteine protease
MQGRCVGSCRQSFTRNDSDGTILSATELAAGGAGESERLAVSDRRAYGLDGTLIRADQAITSAEGASTWRLTRNTLGAWSLAVTAGGMTHTQEVHGVTDNLMRTLQEYRGIKNRSIRPGDSFIDTAFDLTSGTPMTEVTACIESPSQKNGFLWIFSDLQSAIGRIDTLKIDTTGATVSAGQYPFVMRRRERNAPTPSESSLMSLIQTLAVGAKGPAGAGEQIALLLDSGLTPDSSVAAFFRHAGNRWILRDQPGTCPGPGGAAALSPAAQTFISPTVTMQSDDPKIMHLADSLVKGAPARCDSIAACCGWVYATLEKRPSPTFANAMEVLASGYGDCKEHAVLLGALLRAVKIPARKIDGLVYWQRQQAYAYHAWVMAESNGSWLFADPALGVFPAPRDRIPLVIDDSGTECVRLAKFIGRISIEYVKKDADKD